MATSSRLSRASGPLLIAIASILWATDALFRVPTVQSIHPTVIVLFEHLIVTSILLPLALMREGKKLFRLSAHEWISIVWIGAGASAFATVLFTSSFQYLNPSVVILLQKLQPILVVLLAYAFLGERPANAFYGWAAIALAAALWLSFPDLSFPSVLSEIDIRSSGALFSVTAAALWAVATVLGKSLLNRHSALKVTFLRFLAGVVALMILVVAGGKEIPWQTVAQPEIIRALLYMSLMPGLAAMYFYYSGLRRTSASAATFVELLFPVGAVILNTFFLGASLSIVQFVAGSLLLLAVYRVSVAARR